MSAHWKELLPVDQYVVTQSDSIHMPHLKTISALYQPLIGPLACQLYTTFLFEAEAKSETRSHYHLMLLTASSLEVFFQERKKLEALGLLSVFKKKEQESAVFHYELKKPLEPEDFFADGLLSIYLFNRVGRTEYLRLKEQFSSQIPPHADEDYADVTAAFNEVFMSLQPSELKSLPENMSEPYSNPFREVSSPQLSIDFDFDQLFLQLSDVIISEKAFTEPVREAIRQLSFVYQIGPQAMASIIQQAFIHSGEIDIPILRKAVRRYYQLENGDQLPSLSLRSETRSSQEKPVLESESEYDGQVRLFESISPYDLLRSMANGAEPVQSDLRIVEGLLFEQKLPPGVVNVLLDYTMLVNDKKLIKSYIEKIASHWARKQIKTVREAMDIAKSEHKKYQSWSSSSQTPVRSKQTYKPRVNTRQEVLPKWMKNEKGNASKKVPPSQKDDAFSKEQEKWLADYLKSL